MSALADSGRSVSPLVVAAELLVARDFLRELELPHPTVTQIIDATGATRSRAYEVKEALLELLPSLHRHPGRPPEPELTHPDDVIAELSGAMLRFVMDHPGCVSPGDVRQRYTTELRAFVLELRSQHPQVPAEAFATTVGIPAGTFADWLRATSSAEPQPERSASITPPAPPPATAADAPEPSAYTGDEADAIHNGSKELPMSAHVETVLAAWAHWRGGFIDFCNHVQQHWRVPFGRTLIAGILEVHGVRLPRRRPGRSPDEEALRRSFETFFPGAQWVGDGSPIEVVIDGEVITLNLELVIDAHTAAVTGMSIRQEEDSAAVVESFEDGVTNAGSPPLAMLLDNKPSNHTQNVDTALGDTIRIRATSNRPQNKAHVEGAFGLFQQSVPALELTTPDSLQTAMQLLTLVAIVWARTLNHRPRSDRYGRSRVDLYGDKPSDEQIAEARISLEERCRQQLLARQTFEARQDPLVRDTLDDAFEHLRLDDPERHFRNAIARYPLDAIVAGIATFRGKRDAGTLPPNVDARYLLGIVRNIANKREGLAIAEALLTERLAARDRALALLQRQLDELRIRIPAARDRLPNLIDRALGSPRRIDQLFWLHAAADLVAASDDSTACYATAARRIHADFRVPYAVRLQAVDILAANLVPVA